MLFLNKINIKENSVINYFHKTKKRCLVKVVIAVIDGFVILIVTFINGDKC